MQDGLRALSAKHAHLVALAQLKGEHRTANAILLGWLLAQLPVEDSPPSNLTPDQQQLLEALGITEWSVSQNEQGQIILTYTPPEAQPKTPIWLILLCAAALVLSGVAIGAAATVLPPTTSLVHRC